MSSAAEQALSWGSIAGRVRAAVEGVASTDPNPADPFRGLYVSDELALSLAHEAPPGELDARLASAAKSLELDPLERAVLAVCAAPDLDPRCGRLYAYLHDDVTRKLASPRLVGRLLEGDGSDVAEVLACFAHDRPLRRRGAITLLDGDGQIPLAERLVKVADRLAAHLLGTRLEAPPAGGKLRPVAMPDHGFGRADSLAELRALLASPSRLPILVAGPDAHQMLASALERPLLVADIGELQSAELMASAALIASLEGGRLAFDGLEELRPDARTGVVRALVACEERVLLCAPSADAAAALGDLTLLLVEPPPPSFAERREAWGALSGSDEVGDVAAKFRLSLRQIEDATEVARQASGARGAKKPSGADLDRGARQASSTRLAELASRLGPGFTWDDLVLPERQQELLRSISAYLRHRDLVLTEWGYERAVARTQGLKVLFAGESGTGKTLAAQVLAHDLGLELFRIDLATVVSKYIGETEKNLDHIFSAAEGSNAILFFDEADALFGKRSDVQDAHDRYANIEVAYLLQKMDSYAGAVILATNLRQNIDDAFLRRLDFVIDFPFPEVEDRERIWRLLLPEAAPLGGDIDLTFLAAQFKLSGGGIRNCSLAAAFQAADDGGRIGMAHLVRAVALEYGKLGRLTLESDFERFHELVTSRG